MIRCTILAMLLIVSPALAEPIPKESEAAKIKRVWGEFVDEAGGTKVKLDGEKLKMTLPKGLRRPVKFGGWDPVPYIVKPCLGDFSITTTVRPHRPPEGTAKDRKEFPLTAAGLIVIFDEQTAMTFSRAYVTATKLRFGESLRDRTGEGYGTGLGLHEDETTEIISLCMTRVGKRLSTAYSRDGGKTWQGYHEKDRLTNNEVKVGVYAEHSINAETTAVYEGFAITKPKK